MTAPLAVFTEVPVVPVVSVGQHVPHGGPIWPEFEHRILIRHCRNNVPVDTCPALPPETVRVEEDCVWGGFLDSHFGHFVAEHLPRLPAALRERPDDTYLFTVDPGMTRDGLPAWVGQVFDWIGLRLAQVRLVTEPLTVRCLRVGVQGEMLPQVAPKPGYLDLIAPWARAVEPVAADLLYVARTGLADQGAGVHAGESYVVERLRQQGVAVLDPARAPLAAQMAAYAGAVRIIFAKGSALHGRQLLGPVAQDIAVIRRRPGKRMAEAMLTPRCRALRYHDVGDQTLMAYWSSGAERPNPAMRLYDIKRLFRVFQGFGIDLARDWDDDAYAVAALADVEAWVGWHKPKDKHWPAYAQALTNAGLTRL